MGSDLTSVMTGEGQAAVFVAVDHGSAECVGLHASRSADRFEALEPVGRRARALRCFRQKRGQRPRPSARPRFSYVSHHFQAEIRFLGIASSPAFVREPASAGCCRPRCATDRLRAAADGQRLRRALHSRAERA